MLHSNVAFNVAFANATKCRTYATFISHLKMLHFICCICKCNNVKYATLVFLYRILRFQHVISECNIFVAFANETNCCICKWDILLHLQIRHMCCICKWDNLLHLQMRMQQIYLICKCNNLLHLQMQQKCCIHLWHVAFAWMLHLDATICCILKWDIECNILLHLNVVHTQHLL